MGDEQERDCGLRGITELSFDPNARKIQLGDKITLNDIDRDQNNDIDTIEVRFLNCETDDCTFNDFYLNVGDPKYTNDYPEFLRLFVQNLRGKIASLAGGTSYKAEVSDENPYQLRIRHERLKSAYFDITINGSLNSSVTKDKALTYFSYFKDDLNNAERDLAFSENFIETGIEENAEVRLNDEVNHF